MDSNTSIQTFLISELIEEIAMGPFGSNIKVDCFVDEGVPVFNGSNLTGFTTNDDELRYVTEEKAKSLGRALASRGDVVVTHRGTLGQIAYIPNDSLYEHYIISQSQFRMRMNEKVLPAYLVYYFHTPLGQWKIMSNKAQTGVPALGRPTSTFQKIEIELPNIETQEKVIRLLDSIQSAIKLNQQTNDYLEALGGALVERYIARCDEAIPLKELLDFGNGFAFKSETYVDNGKYKVLTIKNVQDGNVDCSGANRIDEIPGRMKDFCRLSLGDVVLSLTGNVGRVGIVSEPDCVLNQRVAVFLPNAEHSLAGLYFWFRQDAFKDRMIGIARGTAQANLSPIETLQLEIPFNEDGFAELCEDAQPLYDAILANKTEMMVLASLRDALLPKLMSGEIDVSLVELPMQPNNQ